MVNIKNTLHFTAKYLIFRRDFFFTSVTLALCLHLGFLFYQCYPRTVSSFEFYFIKPKFSIYLFFLQIISSLISALSIISAQAIFVANCVLVTSHNLSNAETSGSCG